MSQLYASVPAESNSGSPSCDCLAHRCGNAVDGPDRVPCYVSDLTEAEWQVVRAGTNTEEGTMRNFKEGETVVRRDVHRGGRVWNEQALRVVADTSEALMTACPPGAETRWPALYAKARADGDRTVRTEAFDAMATGVWQETCAPSIPGCNTSLVRGDAA